MTDCAQKLYAIATRHLSVYIMSEPVTPLRPYTCRVCAAVTRLSAFDATRHPFCTACGSRDLEPPKRVKPSPKAAKRAAMWDHYTDDE